MASFKIIFAVLALTVVAAAHVCENPQLKKVFGGCIEKCAKSDQVKLRLKSWNFEVTDEDRCFMECGWKGIGKLKPDGNVDLDSVVEQFNRFGVEVPAETYDLANTGGSLDQLIEKTNKWALPNKEAIIKACF